jgi:hypothetical protein
MLPLLLVPVAAGNFFPEAWARAPSTLPRLRALFWPLALGATLVAALLLTDVSALFVALSWAVQLGLLFLLVNLLLALINAGRLQARWQRPAA